jgi:hypothetical protein
MRTGGVAGAAVPARVGIASPTGVVYRAGCQWYFGSMPARVPANLAAVLPTIRARDWRAVRDAPGPAAGEV